MAKITGYGSAPGKVILSGEHSVVYNQPAIAVALDLRCYAELSRATLGLTIIAHDLGIEITYSANDLKDGLSHVFDGLAKISGILIPEPVSHILEIRSDIPISSGLGSSAAVAVACVAAIADMYDIELSNQEISDLAFQSEQIVHGKPSGIDNSITTWGGALVFDSGEIELKKLVTSIPLIIINSEIPRNTKQLVAGVADLMEEIDEVGEIIKIMGGITRKVIEVVDRGDIEYLGKLMNINQGLLDAIGVGHNILSHLIWQVRDAGALGAKLTGAGGGGCLIAILPDGRDQIVTKLRNSGINVIQTSTSTTGVIIGRDEN